MRDRSLEPKRLLPVLALALLTLAGCGHPMRPVSHPPRTWRHVPRPVAARALAQPPAEVLPAGLDGAVRAAALPFPGTPSIPPRSINHGRPRDKLVCITFDDGQPFDPRILALFEQQHLSATTFLLGEVAARRPQLVARLERDGFEIANHTWDHKDLAKLSDAEIRDELVRTQQAISRVTGNQAPYLRPPGGATNARVRRVAASLGYSIVMWDESFADTSRFATPEKLYHNVMDRLRPGDIILCHWGGRDTYEALQLILPELARRGYATVPLSVMLQDEGAAG